MTIAPAKTVIPSSRSSKYSSSKIHQVLLQATIFQGQPALETWQKWRNQVDIETLDSESHHLLSLLYPNLLRHGVDDPDMSRFKGVYRRTWYVNQLLVQSFVSVLQALQKERVNTLVLGEMALVSTVYPDYGHRPVYQLDLFVPQDQTVVAINTLQQLGWTTPIYLSQPDERLWKKPLQFWPSAPSHEALSIPLYLHNHLFRSEPQSYTDQQLWANAITTEINNWTTPILSPVDQLLHLCLKNNQKQKQRPIYWLADAATLVNSFSGETDWVRLVTQAQRYEIILPLRYLLIELKEILNLSLPDWVLPSLNQMAISYYELLEYNLLPDHKLLLLKSRLVRFRKRWKQLMAGDSNR